jgi:ubiquinone/menaquinone biosynthesis C-methylase UbiE
MSIKDQTRGFYERNALNYYEQTSSIVLSELWQLAESQLSQNSRVLDVGSGSGRDVIHFNQVGYNAIGMDYSFNLVKLSHQNVNKVIVADMRNVPFPSEYFDLVWSIGSLLHIYKTKARTTVNELARIIKKDGFILTSLKMGKGGKKDSEGRYNVYYELEEWNNILTSIGFSIKKSYSVIERRKIKTDYQNERMIEWIVTLAQKE